MQASVGNAYFMDWVRGAVTQLVVSKTIHRPECTSGSAHGSCSCARVDKHWHDQLQLGAFDFFFMQVHDAI